MLSFGATTSKAPSYYSYSRRSMISHQHQPQQLRHPIPALALSCASIKRGKSARSLLPMQILTAAAVSAVSLAAILVIVEAGADASEIGNQPQPQQLQESEETGTLSNIPQTLSSECFPGECNKGRIQRPKSRKAEVCTVKCVTTCIRGGLGSPGEGPLNVRRPLVVFKQGFRSRQYCLAECSEICNLLGDGDDGP